MIRRIARPLVAAVFIYGGVDTLLHPEPRADKAEPVLDAVAPVVTKVAGISLDREQLVRVDAGVKVAAGLLLTANRLPRLSSAALAASLAPTTLGGHRFWEEKDKAARRNQATHLLKNLSILGGLLIAVVDPGPRHAAQKAAAKVTKAAAKAVT